MGLVGGKRVAGLGGLGEWVSGGRLTAGDGKVAGRACPAPTGWRGRVADERGKGGRQPAPFAVGGGCPLMSGIAKSRAGHARPLRTAVSGNGGSGEHPTQRWRKARRR